jgi:hypothetical protein
MLSIIRTKIDPKTLQQAAEDFTNYIKIVVDVRRGILAAGGPLHADGKALLLKDGSLPEDLWGAGLDLETGEMDFESMINYRSQQNSSREILDPEVRQKVGALIRDLLGEGHGNQTTGPEHRR